MGSTSATTTVGGCSPPGSIDGNHDELEPLSPASSSCGRALDHTDPPLSRHDPQQLEAGRVVEGAELGLRALAPSGVDEHIDVVCGRAATRERLVDARRIDTLYDQQLAVLAHRAMTILENGDSAV